MLKAFFQTLQASCFRGPSYIWRQHWKIQKHVAFPLTNFKKCCPLQKWKPFRVLLKIFKRESSLRPRCFGVGLVGRRAVCVFFCVRPLLWTQLDPYREFLWYRIVKHMCWVPSLGCGRFRELREACRKKIDLSWYLSDFMVFWVMATKTAP